VLPRERLIDQRNPWGERERERERERKRKEREKDS
jgi:hypothetical protein